MRLAAFQSIAAAVVFVILGSLPISAQSDTRLATLISDVKSGPAVYHSPEALAHYARRGGSSGYPVQNSSDKETALRCLRATVKLGELGIAAREAVPVLIEVFPRAVHVSELRSMQYGGEGTYEDWVHTYVMSEKNKFILSSPFLDYSGMSACEQFVEGESETQNSSGSTVRAAVKGSYSDIAVKMTLHAAACALSRITGAAHGNDQNAWRQWWVVNGGTFSGPVASGPVGHSPSSLSSGISFADIVKGGKYRMTLTTGDDLVGVVETKTDSSLILETTDGKPYSFKPSLIVRYEQLSLPKSLEAKTQHSSSKGINEAEILSFEEARQRVAAAPVLQVSISSGSVFKGKLVGVDDEMIRIDVGGSTIPISKDVVQQISTVPPEAPKEVRRQEPTKPQGPSDTVVVKSTESDDYGNRKADIIYSGHIESEDGQAVTLKLSSGSAKRINRPDIVRIVKHSTNDFEEPIKRYAKPLFCPDDMFLVDMPPGRAGRPFFKVCVDRFEFPNQHGAMPQGNVSYDEAQRLCEGKGKRICTAEEWRWACSGIEGYAYPYGWNQEKERCNTDGSRLIEPSGSRINCVSKFGGSDMSGNIFEWVNDGNKGAALMGGPYSKCQTVSPGVGGSAKPQTGLRCCKSN